MPSRTEERENLLIGLAHLIDPIRRLVFAADDVRSKVPYIRAQLQADLAQFMADASLFCRPPGKHTFEHEFDRINGEARRFGFVLDAIESADGTARQQFEQRDTLVRSLIRAVPCDDPGTILPSASPYATYVRLRAIRNGTTDRFELFDPYLDAETFHRYLPEIPDGIGVTIVTQGDVMDLPPNAPSKAQARRDRIVAVSELLSLQHPDRYQFRVTTEQHDRHIRCDYTILHLGGSLKDAGKFDYFTISTLHPTQSNHAFLDGIAGRATEWFGPAVRVHRRT